MKADRYLLEDEEEPPQKRWRRDDYIHEYEVGDERLVISFPKEIIVIRENDENVHEFFVELFKEIDVHKGTPKMQKIFRQLVPGTQLGSLGFFPEEDSDEDSGTGPDAKLDETLPRWFALGCDRGTFLNYHRFASRGDDILGFRPYKPLNDVALHEGAIGLISQNMSLERFAGMPEEERDDLLEEYKEKVAVAHREEFNTLSPSAPETFICMEGRVRADKPVWVLDVRETELWDKMGSRFEICHEDYFSFFQDQISGLDGYVGWDTFSFLVGWDLFSGAVGEAFLTNPSEALVGVTQTLISKKDVYKRGREVIQKYYHEVGDKSKAYPIPLVE